MSEGPEQPVYKDEEAPFLEPNKTEPLETETVGRRKVPVNMWTGNSQLEDNPQCIKANTGRTEEMSKNIPVRPDMVFALKFGVVINTIFLFALLLWAASLYSVIHFYSHPETSGKFIVLVLVVNNILISIGTILLWHVWLRPHLPPAVLASFRSVPSEIVTQLGFLLALTGFFLYLNGNISPASTVSFFIAPVILNFLDLILSICIPNYGNPANSFSNIIISVQYLVFILNLLFIHSEKWNWVLLLWVTGITFMVFFSSIAAIVTVVSFFVWLVKLRRQFQDYLISTWAFSFMVFLSSFGFFAVFLFIGFRRLLEHKAIFNPSAPVANPDPALLHCAWATLIFIAVIFAWNLLLLCPVYSKIRNKFFFTKVQRRTLYYKEPLLMKITLVSSDFFKKSVDVPEDTPKEKFSLCFVCVERQADTLIYSCGHTGACLNCVREAHSIRNTCMTCKGPISKVKKIKYDEEDDAFYTVLEDTYPSVTGDTEPLL